MKNRPKMALNIQKLPKFRSAYKNPGTLDSNMKFTFRPEVAEICRFCVCALKTRPKIAVYQKLPKFPTDDNISLVLRFRPN